MSKEISLNDEIVSKMRSVLGNDIDPSRYAVFECRAISAEPITKTGGYSIVNKGVPTDHFIQRLVQIANEPERNISVHIMHNSFDLAIGRVFDVWEKREMSGVNTARARLAILKSEETEVVLEKIKAGILDEVSVGFSIASGKCSACGYDFFDESIPEDERAERLWTGECPNGHKMGDGDIHLLIDDLSDFEEVSIVNQGAANRAKIQDEKRFSFSLKEVKENVKLALTNVALTTLTSKLENTMTEEEIKTLLAEKQSKIDKLEAKLSSSEAAQVAAKEEGEPKGEGASAPEPATKPDSKDVDAPAEEEKEEGSAELDKAKAEIERLKAEVETKDAELSATKTAFTEEVNKALVAAGKEQVSPETELSAMVKALVDARITLSAAIPVNGKALSADSASKDEVTVYGLKLSQLESFK